eukprot:PhM_4_TR5216/c0_g1_i1/m.103702/K03178/UBE1, UBA1; ubiquitin-activating enzyme E1
MICELNFEMQNLQNISLPNLVLKLFCYCPRNPPSKHMSYPTVDTDLFSRQIHVLGMSAMKRMATADVLIFGLSGTGVEIAKNIILSGVRSVHLLDNNPVCLGDCATAYCASPNAVGKPRADAYAPCLSELNPGVRVEVVATGMLEGLVPSLSCAVVVDATEEEALKFTDHCRQNSIPVVVAECVGLTARTFVDGGESFTVDDPLGALPVRHLVTKIERSDCGEEVTIHVDDSEKKSLQLPEEDWILFEGFHGPASCLNTVKAQITRVGKSWSSLERPNMYFNVRATPELLSVCGVAQGGYIEEAPVPKVMKFSSFRSEVHSQTPTFQMDMMRDLASMHVAFSAYHAWTKEHSRTPHPYDDADAQSLVSAAQKIKPDVSVDFVRMLSHTASGSIAPMTTFIGGVAGHEVLKVVSGKFVPIHQWFYFDAASLYKPKSITPDDVKVVSTRYGPQIACLGPKFQDKLESQNLFVVGSGALGCEYVKIFALTGAACGKRGNISITDNDRIERSNLSRQFLFRNQHVGQYKSKTAADSARAMNSGAKFRVLTKKVAKDTEDTFDERFWAKQSIIVNALDNIPARVYVDSKCVQFRKPLVEAGTLGPKANVQMIVPGLTQNYNGGDDDQHTGGAPACTVHFYPTTVEHCVHYAKDMFAGMFTNPATEVNAFLSDPEGWVSRLKPATMHPVVRAAYGAHVAERPSSAEECVKWARGFFEDTFVNAIKQLLFTHPADKIDTTTNKPFWSGSRKCPHLISFSDTNEQHITFVRCAAWFRAQLYGIPFSMSMSDVRTICQAMTVPTFVPQSDVVIPASEEEVKSEEPSAADNTNKQREEERTAETQRFLDALKAKTDVSLVMHPLAFEKDDPKNGHIDFIAATTNIRASCYDIPQTDSMNVQRISGNIIPAMVTTTALITGLGALELFKVVQSQLGADVDYFNSYVDLSVPYFLQTETMPPDQISYFTKPPTSPHPLSDKTFSAWDEFEIRAPTDVTVKDFIDAFDAKYHLKVEQITLLKNRQWLFNALDESQANRLSWPLGAFASKVLELPSTPKSFDLIVTCSAGDGQVTEKLPLVRYEFQ